MNMINAYMKMQSNMQIFNIIIYISSSKTQFGPSTLLCGTWELTGTDSATKDVEDEH